jgi:5,5'-dehydrodivanillate O-demethylase oxygenase subunit
MDTLPAEPTYADILRVGPGTLAGRYLRRFWQPVCTAEEIAAGHVKPIRILGEDLTLFRGESGAPHIIADRCPHRGVQLRLGFVEGDELRCAYHGWKFDAKGQCVEQPAETRPFCDKVKIRAYPAQEYLGLVFGWFGEGEAPPLPRLADYEDDELYVREIATETWDVSYFDLLENATDIAHTEFLHWHFGNKAPEKLEWHETGYGLAGRFEGATGKADLYNRSYFQMPTSAEFAISGRTGREGYFTCAWRVPRDDDSAIRFNLFAFPRAQLKGWKPGMSAYAALRGLSTANAEEREKSEEVRKAQPVEDLVDALLTGREDMNSLRARSGRMNYRYLTNVQDYAVLKSLGPPAKRQFTETFGRTDASVAMLRRVFLRELKALAEGRPLKEWRRPPFLWDDVTALHRAEREAAAAT